MSEAIVVAEAVRVPAHALTMRAVRASGPGGQNVNKVATKVELRVDLDAIEGLSAPARARLATLTRGRLDAEGRLKTHAGVPKQPDAEAQRQQEEHARVRRETIAKAKEYEQEERQAAIAAQENPPTDLWEVMPKYELVGTAGE